MKINPQTFFNFCAAHAPLLRAIAGREGEIVEADALRLIRAHPALTDELPETAWRRLRELQILLPIEPGADSYFLAEPVARLLTYLYNEANPATPEMIRGYVLSLETTAKRLARGLDQDDLQQVKLAFEEVTQTLRRIHADLEETQQAILGEVARYKTEQARVPLRVKFRRIVFWMERYVEPMIEIVRADGPLRTVFEEVERLLHRAREEALFNDHPALNRNLRFLRLITAHALRVFSQCRKEVQPLYESLRRSSAIAEGAAHALEKLQAEGIAKWDRSHLVEVAAMRFQNVPGDPAISLALRRVFEHPPEPPPRLELGAEPGAPSALQRLEWLESLPQLARTETPVTDLLEWLKAHHPEPTTADMLAGFSHLIFHPDFKARFEEAPPRAYGLPDGTIEAAPVQLTSL